jgi:hypothetical protein
LISWRCDMLRMMLSWTCCLIGSVTLLAAQAEKVVIPQEFPGGGVVSADTKPMAFVPSASDGIDALDPLSGKVLWSTKEASKPLLANGDSFFALAQVKENPNQVKIVVFEAAKGKKTLESAAIVFPDWVSAPVNYGRSFRSTAHLNGKGLLLIWKAEAFYQGGADIGPEMEKAARKSASGAFRIQLDSGKVAEVKDFEVTDKLLPPNFGNLAQAGIGNMIIKIEDRPRKDNNKLFKVRRFLKANESLGSGSWEHEIAAPVKLPALK